MSQIFNIIRSKLFVLNNHYSQTFFIEFLVLISGLLVYKLAAQNFSKEGFAEYALCRRTVSLIHPVLLLGFAVGIPRFIALEKFSQNNEKAGTYFISGLSISVLVSTIVLSIALFFPVEISELFFGDQSMSRFILPVAILIFGLILHTICYSYFRGKLLVTFANSLQFIIIGLIPLLIFLYERDVYITILYTGILSLAAAMIVVLLMLFKIKFDTDKIRGCARDLLRYGLQRIPGDLMLAAFFALPAFIVAHQSGKLIGGFVAFSVTLIGLAGTAFGPVSLLLLPKSAELIASNNFKKLSIEVAKILKIVIILCLSGLLIFELLADKIIELYLGENFEDLILIARVMILASLGYSVYITLRSVIDAYHLRAVNTFNIFIAFTLFVILCIINLFMNYEYLFIIISYVASLSILGLLTYFQYNKIISKKVSSEMDSVKPGLSKI